MCNVVIILWCKFNKLFKFTVITFNIKVTKGCMKIYLLLKNNFPVNYFPKINKIKK